MSVKTIIRADAFTAAGSDYSFTREISSSSVSRDSLSDTGVVRFAIELQFTDGQSGGVFARIAI
jgi:hypothetical protein